MTTARVDLTTDEIIDDNNNNSYDAKIPILKRRAASASSGGGNNIKDPICVIVVGMAGSGKTTLMSQLQKSLSLRDDNNDRGGDNDEVSFWCGCWRNVFVMCTNLCDVFVF
jgi:predicted ATPase